MLSFSHLEFCVCVCACLFYEMVSGYRITMCVDQLFLVCARAHPFYEIKSIYLELFPYYWSNICKMEELAMEL